MIRFSARRAKNGECVLTALMGSQQVVYDSWPVNSPLAVKFGWGPNSTLPARLSLARALLTMCVTRQQIVDDLAPEMAQCTLLDQAKDTFSFSEAEVVEWALDMFEIALSEDQLASDNDDYDLGVNDVERN